MRLHVLIIDDDPALLAFYGDLLAGEGYRVTLRAEVPADLGEIDRLAPDLIVVDYLFDRQAAGGALLHAMQARPATQQIPMLICTGATQAVQAAVAAGQVQRVGLLLKPFELDDLIAGIEELLGQRRTDGHTVLVASAN
jgi:two-component system phosphate regulon response regulator PhoB